MTSQGGMGRQFANNIYRRDVRPARADQGPHAGQGRRFAGRHDQPEEPLAAQHAGETPHHLQRPRRAGRRRSPSRFRSARNTAFTRSCNVSAIRRSSTCSAANAISASSSICFYSENVAGCFRTTRDFQNTTNQPAYLLGLPHAGCLQQPEAGQREPQGRLPAFAEHKALASTPSTTTPSSRFAAGTRRARSPHQTVGPTRPRRHCCRASRIASRRCAPSPRSIDRRDRTTFNFFNRLRRSISAPNTIWAGSQLDYNAAYSQTHINLGSGKGGVLINRITGVGWILDRTESDLYPALHPDRGARLHRSGQLSADHGRNSTRETTIATWRSRSSAATCATSCPVRVSALLQGWRALARAARARSAAARGAGTTSARRRCRPIRRSSRMTRLKPAASIPQWEAAFFIRRRSAQSPRRSGARIIYFREIEPYTPAPCR